VELFRLHPVVATAVGATAGGVVGFTVGRQWVFRSGGHVPKQAFRYFLVWLVGTALNTGGEHVMLALLGNYLVARFVVATVVGIGWNYEMSRRFVFRERSPEPS
jgi:putative flippase GtrA